MEITLTNGETTLASAGTVVSTTQTIYDDHGRVSKTIDAAGRHMDYEYDSRGRRVATIDNPVTEGGVTVRHRMETEYDEYGNVAREITGIRQLTDGSLDRTDQQRRSADRIRTRGLPRYLGSPYRPSRTGEQLPGHAAQNGAADVGSSLGRFGCGDLRSTFGGRGWPVPSGISPCQASLA